MSKHQLILLLSCFAMTLGVVQYGAAQNPDYILSGEYIVTMQAGTGEKEDMDTGTFYISINFAGDGTVTSEIIYSSIGDYSSEQATYSVNNDGTFSFTSTDEGQDMFLYGIVSSDGESFAMWEGEIFAVGIKKSSGMSDVSLSGEYIMIQYFTNEEYNFSAEYISVDCAGDGTGTFEIISSSAGATGSAPLTYSVDDDGTFFITATDEGEDFNYPGIVSSDGESFTMVLADSSRFGFYVGIKKSSGMSNVSLSGEYIITRYYYTADMEETNAEYISVNFAGDGTGTFEVIYNSGDYEGGAGTFTYSVNDDGTFLFTVTENGGSAAIPGIVSSDGESFTMVLTGSSEFGIYAGIAKSDFTIGINDNYNELPDYYTLKENYPNPFNPTTTIRYSIPQTDFVQLKVYNVVGKFVRTLVCEKKSPGKYTAIWDGRNDKGQLVSSGVYFYTLKSSENSMISKRMLLQK